MADEENVPLLRIVNTDATPEEIAALVAVFSALGSATQDAPERPRPAWNDPARGVRPSHRSGAGAWRASGLPR
ncbi:Acyl-CoA carboxylase epsilon subunit [Nocardioides alpinus]|uniref:Acyl-CoA carboxylase epsilon subunit n=1 Tax=Nocardioides alpinus TaxID=748909 RepID=A0A1I1ADM1_9ACTN|nr:acyl-CoA carboxylase subunit epsilon [Nocardioides alpinus]PKH43426.1 acyl-CoA carboxylase subunit epsilon [Nocardioides alpinus]SFB34580.1 Acyl-CoA carboxylase epsilon subunit [Nocardioides alpinus]